MADLSQAFSEIKSLPDHVLEQELHSPSGMIPGWLALGEIHERKTMRATHQGPDPTKRKSMAEEYAGSIQPLMAGAGMQPPQPQGMPPPQPGLPQGPPQGIAGLAQQAPQGFANGGIVGLNKYQRALLDTISGPESGGRYDVMYGGGKFSDYSQHPGVGHTILTGPNAGQTSSAAGRYQFLGSTWNDIAKRYDLPDFSPQNQDLGAYYLAKERYGGNLDEALQSGDPNTIANIGRSLRGTWTSLPGGIEQGTTADKFVNTYNSALGNPSTAVAMDTTGAANVDVATSAADTAGKMVNSEAAAGGDQMSQMLLMSQLMGGKGQPQAAPPPGGGQVAQARPVDASEYVQNPAFMERMRREHGYG